MTQPPKNPVANGIWTRDLPFLRRTPSPLGQQGIEVARDKIKVSEKKHTDNNNISSMEDIDGGLHPAVDGQSLNEDEDEK